MLSVGFHVQHFAIMVYLYRPHSLVAQLVKNPPAMGETWVQSLGWDDPLENGKSYPLQYSGLENSMDYIVHGGRRESDTTKRFSLSPS